MNDRQKAILQLVDKENFLRFTALKSHFPDISDITLRRDLAALHQEKRLIRTHGGVKSIRFQVGTDGELTYRSSLHLNAKLAIARKAAEYILPNTTIFIDSGSTCLELCRIFPDIPVLVFTSGINCAMELCKRRHVQLHTLGGTVNKNSMAISGPSALSALENLHFGLSFLGALACTDDLHFSIGSEENAFLKREVIHRSVASYMLFDSSKFGAEETFSICRADRLKGIITDDGIAPGVLAQLQQEPVDLIVAGTHNA